MRHTPSGTAPFIAAMGRGKASLPPDADAGVVVGLLKRALHTIECRELGPHAATQRFGHFADTEPGHVFVPVDPERLLAQHPNHAELHGLLQAVRDRGPAVAVAVTVATARA